MHTVSIHNIRKFTLIAAWLLVLVATPLAADTTITYQGQLHENSVPHSGSVGMTFTLWDAVSGGTQVGPQIAETVPVDQGLFQAELDFGSVFDGEPVWLQVQVDGVTLSPRQPVRAVPLAITALSGGGETSPWTLSGGILSYGDVVAIGGDPAEDTLFLNGGLNAANNSDDNNTITGSNSAEFGTGIRAEGYNAFWAEGTYTGVTAFGDTFGSIAIGETLGIFAAGETGVQGHTGVVDGYSGYFSGVDGSRNYFEHAVGLGTLEPEAMLHIVDTTGDSFPQYLRITDGTDIKFAVFSNGIILGPGTVGSSLYLDNYLTGGQTSVCKQTSTGNPAVGYLAQCSSSARYKKDIESLGPVGDLVARLRPVSYRWIDSDIEEIGLVAEEVAEVEPRLATYNAEGQIEGVRYRQLAALLVGALQEQQAEIAELKTDAETLESLKADNAALAARLVRLEALLDPEPQLAMEE